MKQYIPLTLSEFQKIKAGDRIICRIGDRYHTETVITGAFYNYDSDSPEWEVETLNGAFCCDCVYKEEATPEFFAVTRWLVEDVQQLRPEWTEEECTHWWRKHEKAFEDLLTEYGNECLQSMIEGTSYWRYEKEN